MNFHIRTYKPSDRLQIENIHFKTGLIGGSMDPLLSDNTLWKRFLYPYFNHPEHILILASGTEVVGYCMGCIDEKHHKDAFIQTTLQNLFLSLAQTNKDRRFWIGQIRSLLKAATGISQELQFKTPHDAGHFHINLLPEARGKGHGAQLLHAFETQARDHGCKMLHADSYLHPEQSNASFWKKNGYSIHSKIQTSLWECAFGDTPIYLVCYVKKL
ncbi:MAG: GNAT family N-acetyltransferase [Nanoarchaeota archaeon]